MKPETAIDQLEIFMRVYPVTWHITRTFPRPPTQACLAALTASPTHVRPYPPPPNLPVWIPSAPPTDPRGTRSPVCPVRASILSAPRLSSSSSSTGEREEGPDECPHGWENPAPYAANHQYRRSQCRISREYAWMTSRARGFGAS